MVDSQVFSEIGDDKYEQGKGYGFLKGMNSITLAGNVMIVWPLMAISNDHYYWPDCIVY